MSKAKDDSCVPGDITISQVQRGWMLGRVLPMENSGPWWEYLDVVAELPEAVKRGKVLARTAAVRLWVHTGRGHYDPVALDD